MNRSIIKRLNSRRFSAFALALSMLAVGAAANAQSTTGPGGVDYGGLSTNFSTAITPIMSTALPVGVVILGIWMAPRLLKKMLKTFAGG